MQLNVYPIYYKSSTPSSTGVLQRGYLVAGAALVDLELVEVLCC